MVLLQAWYRSLPDTDVGPIAAVAGTLNLVVRSKAPEKTESGVGEKLYFSISGFG